MSNHNNFYTRLVRVLKYVVITADDRCAPSCLVDWPTSVRQDTQGQTSLKLSNSRVRPVWTRAGEDSKRVTGICGQREAQER